METIRKGSEIELQVEKLAFGGQAVARVEGFVVFIDHALPGQRVRARIVRKKRQYAEAQVVEVLSQSPHYVEPRCPHFSYCGGCKWQDLSYEQQLHWKRIHVLECIEHLAGVEEAVVSPVVPSPEVWYYRNKMEFTFSSRRWLLPEEIASGADFDRSLALGLHVQGFFDKIFDVQSCFLESPQAVEILRETREWCKASGLAPYAIRDHLGYWRFLVIREGKRTGQTLVHLLTSGQQHDDATIERLAAHLGERFPAISTFVHSISGKKAQVATGELSRAVTGPGYIEEKLGDLRFRISPHSFFQTNPLGAEKLYETVKRFGDFTGSETVWDLYCGTGSIALFIASAVKRVVGFEVVQDAVDDAYVNCELNGVKNCDFLAGDLKDVIREARDSSRFGSAPDIVVTDPPRAGMHPNVVKVLLELAPRRIVYVSCNPSTLARDVAALLGDYEVQAIQPFDLFPHTPHIECVVRLERRP
ncbi:MAG: 23S rRNA (uracil(1939)-C(5))-methyltransferase RlmD [Acidobacteriota bacterium]